MSFNNLQRQSRVGLLAFLLYKPLLSLFLPLSAFTGEGISADQAQTSWELALSVGRRRLLIIGMTYFLYALMDNTAAFCRGLGYPNTPSIIAFFCVTFYRVVFILTLWNLVPYFHTLPWLWSIWPISWILAGLVYVFLVPRYLKEAYLEMDKQALKKPTAAAVNS